MPSPLPPDPYKVLGVCKDANSNAIRSAHRKLVLTCHPDKFPDEAIKTQKADEFHRVQQAYELLSDEKRRERYDELVKLAELKAEVLREGSGSRRAENAYAPRSPAYEYRREPHYEEIRPRGTRHEDAMRHSPRYEDRDRDRERDREREREQRERDRERDYRPQTRTSYDDQYDFHPATSTSKKATMSRSYKDDHRSSVEDTGNNHARRRWRTATTKIVEDARAKEYEDRRKSRDKGRKDDVQSQRFHTRLESGSETESEVDAFMRPMRSPESRRKHDTGNLRRARREEDHRMRREESPSSMDEAHSKINQKVQSAADYIQKSLGKPPTDWHDRRRPSISRGHSSSRATAPPPPPPPPVPLVDQAKRSSARRGASLSSKLSTAKEKKIEIVEPPSARYESSRRPGMVSAVTSPIAAKGSSNSGNLPRAATMEVRSSEKQPSLRRAQTSPHTPQSAGYAPSKSSKLRPTETHDSGYSSPGTPEALPQAKQYSTRSYRIVEESDSDELDRPTIVPVDLDRRRERDISPRTHHRSERLPPQTRASARKSPNRSQTHDESSTTIRPPPLSRSATSPREPLFGEIPRDSADPRGGEMRSPPYVRYGPRYETSDIRYTDHPRRHSPADRDSRMDQRDAYPYDSRDRRAGMGARTTTRVQESY